MIHDDPLQYDKQIILSQCSLVVEVCIFHGLYSNFPQQRTLTPHSFDFLNQV